MAQKNDNLTKRTHEQRVEDGRKGGNSPKVKYMPELQKLLYTKGREKITVSKEDGKEIKDSVISVAFKNLLRKMAKGDTKAWDIYFKFMSFGQDHQTIELTGKDGEDLIPAKRLTPEEMKAYIEKLNEDY